MAISRIKTWANEVLTANDLNAEFDNLANNVASDGANSDITSLTGLTTPLGAAYGGTGGTGGAIAPTIVDAKGDLIVGTAADTAARLAVGANDTFLVADSAQTAGMKWASISTMALAQTSAANIFTAAQTVRIDDATTNAVTTAATVSHTTTGTPANGIGVGINFEVETTAGNNEVGAGISAVVTDVTAASEDFKLSFETMAAGAAKTERGYIGQGFVMGSPTGGDMGAATFNVANGLYDNGTRIQHKQTAKARAYFQGTGTVQLIDNHNVSSITDNGTGNYTVNFTSALPSNYAALVTCGNAGGTSVIPAAPSSSPTTTAYTFLTYAYSGGANTDAGWVSAVFFHS